MLPSRLLAAAVVVLALGGCTSDESLGSTPPVAQASPSPSATPPTDPTPSAPASVTPEDHLAACLEMRRALQGVTRERLAPYPPLSAEGYALVSDAEHALAKTQTRLISTSDEAIMWRAGSALNQIIIGDQEPPPFALLDSIRRELTGRCRE